METAVHTEGLSKRYALGATIGGYSRLTEDIGKVATRLLHRPPAPDVEQAFREIWALKDVSLDIAEGEIVGIVGRNGAGKSTLLKVLARITEPTEGRALIRGRVGSLLEVGTGFHPELTGRENVYLNGAILGMRRNEIRSKFSDIVAFAELERFVDTPVKRYSSGMYVRLAFSVAAFLEPEILFIDEVLSVGDHAFQQRCIGRMGEIAKSGRTIIFVSHNLASVSALCTRAVLLSEGTVARDGDVDSVLEHYLTSIETQTSPSLSLREDRQGDGRLRIVDADVLATDGSPARTGRDAVVRLGFESKVRDAELSIGIAVEGPMGEPIFQCSTTVTGDRLVVDSARGRIDCLLPKLPLLAGRYTISIYAELNGVVVDWVRNAVFFDVFESDVFGTGKLPAPSHGRVLADHSWQIEAGG